MLLAVNFVAYWCTLVFHQLFQFHWRCIHFVKSSHLLLNSSKLPLAFYLRFVAKCSSLTNRALVPPHHAHTITHSGHELMLHDVWFYRFPCFVFYCLTWDHSSVFLSKPTTQLLVLCLGNNHAWFHWYIFGCLHLSSSPYVASISRHLPLKPRTFLLCSYLFMVNQH